MTTNSEWLWKLAHEHPDELSRWLHADHESCAQHADQRGQAKVDDGESYDSREKLTAFANRIEACAKDESDVTLFGVDYVPVKKLEKLQALLAKLGEFDDDNDIDAPDYYERCWGGHVRTINEQRVRIKQFKETLERVVGERDWFRSQFEKCLRATRCANVDDLMAYPLPEQHVEPYQIVTDAIDSQRDFSADVARLTAERDNLAADLADAMKRIERYKSAMRDIGRAIDWCEDKGMA